MIQMGKSPDEDQVYKIDEAAKILGFPFGRTKLYIILKELDIVDNNNAPKREYVEKGYLKLAVPELRPNPRFINHPVTLVNGKEGLDFIKKIVNEYLEKHPIPKVKRRERVKTNSKWI